MTITLQTVDIVFGVIFAIVFLFLAGLSGYSMASTKEFNRCQFLLDEQYARFVRQLYFREVQENDGENVS